MPRPKKNDPTKPAVPKGGRKKDFEPQMPPEKAHACEVPGCGEPGVYKAPKSRDELHEYRWYCLGHIREHNEKWDFFAGLDRDNIEDFIKDSVTGHRPTWQRESHIRDNPTKLHDAIYEFLHWGRKAPPSAPPLKASLRKALAVMDMTYPYTEKELKKQYRSMVKIHHPDANKGDKKAEERFKQITAAYQSLLEHLKKPS